MKVIQHVEAPQALIDLIINHYEPIYTIKTVMLIAEDPFELLNGHMGMFIPEQEAVVISLKACMEDQRWMKRGMSFVANVWCNLLYTAFHEGVHAEQMINEEIVFDEATWDIQHEILDHAADMQAMEQLIDWFNIHAVVPPLEQLGWVGARIQELFNNIYSKAPDAISTELDLVGTEAGGLAMGAAQGPDFEEHEVPGLMEAIDRGDIGIQVKGHKCLRIDEILGADREVRG